MSFAALLLVAGAAAQEADNERGELFGSGYFGEPEALAGCVGRVAVDVKDDGSDEWVWLHFYDGEGRPWQIVGYPGIGTWKFVRMEFSYDPEGRLLRRRWDGNGDHLPDRVIDYRYDGDELIEVSDQSAGSMQRTRLHWGAGELRSYTVDVDGDGRPDADTGRRFEDGLLVGTGTDNDGDGEWDGTSELGYDPRGRPSWMESDFDADGVADQLDETSWDTDGRITEKRKDIGMDGRLDVRTRVTWACPARRAAARGAPTPPAAGPAEGSPAMPSPR